MGLKRLARFLGVRQRLVWLFKWQKRVTRIESWQYRQHVLQRTGRDCTRLGRSGVLWVGECDIANAWPAEHSPRLEMEVQCSWGPTRGFDTVFLWVQAKVTEGKISLGKKPTKEMLADSLTKDVDAATMQSCIAGLGMRFQSGESKLTPESVMLFS